MDTRPTSEAGPDVAGLVVGVLGGTGPLGLGLASRLAKSGQRLLIGSRTAAKAEAAAAGIHGDVRGADNAACAHEADLVIAAVPFEGHLDLLTSLRAQLAGKIVVDCVNPLGFDALGAYALEVPEGSACEQAQVVLPESRIVGAFHHLSAVLLIDESLATIDTDVLVVGDDRAATDLVRALAARIGGARGVYAGRLRNARQVEALTANLISINRRYKAHAGIKVTDV